MRQIIIRGTSMVTLATPQPDRFFFYFSIALSLKMAYNRPINYLGTFHLVLVADIM
jgi:hypothetical protein